MVNFINTLANLGYKITGVEIRKEVLNDLKQKSHFYESNLNKILNKIISNKILDFTTNSKRFPGNTYIITTLLIKRVSPESTY